MNIKDVEKLTGLSKSNIRYYEEEGLIQPQRGENNYRVYSDEDASKLNDIKKLRLLGIPIDSIRSCMEGRTALSEVMKSRLEEIDSDAGILKRQAEVCRAAIENQAVHISDINFDERSETWQRRLAILMRDDIVNHKLTRTEFNRDVLLAYLANCAAAMAVNAFMLLTGVGMKLDNPVLGFVIFALIVVTGIVPMWTGNMKLHTAALVISAALNTTLIWTIMLFGIDGNIPGTGHLTYVVNAGAGTAAKITAVLYLGLAVLAVTAWAISQLSPKLFNSILTAVGLGLAYLAYAICMTRLVLADSLTAGITIFAGTISLIFAMVMIGSWTDINREKVRFTRYSAMLTAFKMTNVAFTLISGKGYYGMTNFKRG